MGMGSRIFSTLASLVTRGIVTTVDDSKKCQVVQVEVLADEILDEVEHFQPFGLSFVPPVDSELVCLAATGDRDTTIALAAQHRDHRPKGHKMGEGGLYCLDGWRVFVDEDGIVYVGPKDAAERASAEPMLLGDQTKAAYDGHMHPTPFGLSGAPSTPLPSGCLSTRSKVL